MSGEPRRRAARAAERPAREVVWLWLPVVAVMIGIYYGAAIPEPPVPPAVTDSSLHQGGYFLLTLLLIRALARERWSGVTLAACAGAIGIALAHGASVEWLQSYLPHRTAEYRDLVADAVGACAAAVAVGAWGIIRRL